MKLKAHEFTLDKAIKLSIIAGILLIASAIFYYLVIYIPHREQEKIDQQKAQQAQQDEAKKTNNMLLQICLTGAEKNYSDNWALNCKNQAQKVSTGYANCLNTSLTASMCRGVWGYADDSPNCSLPTQIADSLNSDLKDAKDQCYKQYSQ